MVFKWFLVLADTWVKAKLPCRDTNCWNYTGFLDVFELVTLTYVAVVVNIATFFDARELHLYLIITYNFDDSLYEDTRNNDIIERKSWKT